MYTSKYVQNHAYSGDQDVYGRVQARILIRSDKYSIRTCTDVYTSSHRDDRDGQDDRGELRDGLDRTNPIARGEVL